MTTLDDQIDRDIARGCNCGTPESMGGADCPVHDAPPAALNAGKACSACGARGTELTDEGAESRCWVGCPVVVETCHSSMVDLGGEPRRCGLPRGHDAHVAKIGPLTTLTWSSKDAQPYPGIEPPAADSSGKSSYTHEELLAWGATQRKIAIGECANAIAGLGATTGYIGALRAIEALQKKEGADQ